MDEEQGNTPQYQRPPPLLAPPSPPALRKRLSRSSVIATGILVVLIAAGALTGIGLVINRALARKKAFSFDLREQSAYTNAMFDIKSYYLKPYDETRIEAAASVAVEKEKKKGVTSFARLTGVGVNALIKALGDPHSNYMTPNENKRMEQDLSGSFFGVGFTLRMYKGRPKVVSVIKGSPSDKASVKSADIIMSVDGMDTKGKRLDNVVLHIRGRQGTKVKIEIERGGKTLNFVITRKKIQIPDFESDLVDGKYGVIRLFEFNRGVGRKVRAVVKDLQARGAQGFILDLRNNPGGLLDEAVQVSSVFVPDGVIVSYQTKGNKKVNEKASGGVETARPLVVLVNGGSASSSEIVAGALKDRERAVLVGIRTYGKGSVQKVFALGDGSAVKLTISLYYLPKGESIDGKGIQPHVVVEDKSDQAKEEAAQFDKAKQALENMIEGKPPISLLPETLPIAA
ncbi:MAG: hypothetical protein CVT63_01915 [Candidatus Anoxymicrobium japonicum]|uniref:PDZ domain-containing protein n=1 Tax=Candidatus Anoxymicrobium japonicum TaxID=2013648 RepID=A0A2N3G7C0_9ACTN|nr:MAG: hypothetical protein CVT63_01915 [Candidatus Anoxymicrobium japonicum]